MNLLVLDTATDRCAVACVSNGVVTENTRSIPRLHNEHLLKMLEALLAEAGVAPADLSAVGFSAGPGSFTGIRISAAVSQALALGADAQVLPLGSSRLLAQAAQREGLLHDAQGVQTVLRSRRNFAYLAHYSTSLEQVRDDVLYDDAALRDHPLPDDWLRIMDASAEDAEQLLAVPVRVTTHDLLAVAQIDLAAGKGLPAEGAQPRYVEGDTPWVPQ